MKTQQTSLTPNSKQKSRGAFFMSRIGRIATLSFCALIVCGTRSAAKEISWNASGQGGAIVTGGGGALAAGMKLLKDGGNAADAAAATLLALTVTDYSQFAIGGEVSLLIYDAKTQKVKVLCGLGRAPLDPKAIDWYYANGIPASGGMNSAPVPGAVDLCVTLLRKYGTKSFAEAVQPTLELLDKGDQDWHPRLAVTLRKLAEAEQSTSGSREDRLMSARDRFYKGDVADELEAWYIETGSFLRKRDLAAHATYIEDPVSVSYRGYTVYKCGPWTQGPMLCQALRILEGFDLRRMGHLSADQIHVTVEALKLAFADRDEYYGDPLYVDVPLHSLFSDAYARKRRPLIDMVRASSEIRPGDPLHMQPLKVQTEPQKATANNPVQDTTNCVVADRWGNVVAATPSCNIVTNRPGPSGVTQGTRLRCLNTTVDHPNRMEAGKRPRITLTPTLVMKECRPVLAISVAGGDLQEQETLNMLINHIDFGMPPETAVTSPRFSTGHHQYSFNPNPDRQSTFFAPNTLRLNSDISESVRTELQRRGHKIKTTTGAIGQPCMLYFNDATGTIYAAGDPKAQRHAAAID
jgi:gamma-glutamyltranspeptidase / glutathione hydrolase